VSTPDYRPDVAASGTGQGPEGEDIRTAGVEALARVLDPVAFDPRAVPKNLGQEWDRCCRQMLALGHARRALAAGYRLVSEESSP